MDGNAPQDELIRDLMQAGYTEYEAKVYLALLHNHPASAYTISQQSGVPHSRVYDVSRRLIEKGYVASSGNKPELYSPLSPGELVDKIRRDNSALTGRLEEALQTIDFAPDFDPVWNIKSPQDAIDKVVEIVSAAQKRIYLGIFKEDFPSVEAELRQAHERGVELFMLIYGEISVDFGNCYFHEREHLDSYEALGRTIECVADSAVCITGNLGENGPTRVVWTKNFGLVFSIENYLIHDLFIREIRNAFGDQLDKSFGKNLQKLRRKFRHLDF